MRELLFFKKVVTTAILLLTAIFVFGCGGGGGPAPTTDPDAVFPLYETGWDVPGYTASFSGSGTVTVQGEKHNINVNYSTHTLNKENLGTVQFGSGLLDINTQVLPVEIILSITSVDTNLEISSISTTYFDAQNKNPILRQTVGGSTSRVTELNIPPSTGKVGDFGKLSTWLHDNDDIETGTWILKSLSPGFILMQGDYTFENSLGDVIAIETDKYKINEDGRRVEVNVLIHDYEDDAIYEFTATRN